MRLSQECRHALAVLAYLAKEPRGKIVASADLSRLLAISRPFLSKILQRLSAEGFVTGHRGAVRGYALARPGGEISARDVVLAIDGAELFSRCVFWSDRCSDALPCPLHDEWARVRPQIESQLAALSVDKIVVPSAKGSSRSRARKTS